MVGTLVKGYRCVPSWYDLDLTFDLVMVTMIFKILSGLFDSIRCRRLTLGRDIRGCMCASWFDLLAIELPCFSTLS